MVSNGTRKLESAFDSSAAHAESVGRKKVRERTAMTKVLKNKYVMILSCDGETSGQIFTDLECCLQRCAEDVFGEVPDEDSDHWSEWKAIEEELVDSGFYRFEDGSISIAKVHA